MKAMIICHGTRGDVQPYIALAHALQQAGHAVLLAAPASTVGVAKPYGIETVSLTDALNSGMDDPVIAAAIETNFRGLHGKRIAVQQMLKSRKLLRELSDEIAAIPAADVDVVIHPINSSIQHLAEKLGVPAVAVALQPGWVPTSSFPNPLLGAGIPRALNTVSYGLNSAILRALVVSGSGWRRETLGLPRRRHQNDARRTPDGRPATVLQAFSPHILPEPARWPTGTHTTGYWFLPAAEEWTPPDRLTEFLDAGEPPIYVGFGSMAGRDPSRVGRTVIDAANLADVRVVLVTGWGGISTETSSNRLLVLDHAPHDWLFPRTRAVVHHGGAGTTAAALASGRPQVVCPFVADQPMWGRWMHERGVAPEPVAQRRLTADRLGAAINEAVTNQPMAAHAAELGRTIRAEDGVERAVRAIGAVLRE